MKEYTLKQTHGKGCIYLLISPEKKCYIGQSWNVKNRWHSYSYLNKKNKTKLHKALKKYGYKKFTYKIIALANNQNELNRKEIFYIKKFNSINIGYNSREGGSRGKHTKETKRKLSLANLGKKSIWFGKKHSIKTIKKMKNAWDKNRKKIHSLFISGNNNPFYGKIHSLISKKKISKIQKIFNKNKKWTNLYVFEKINKEIIYVKCISRYCKLHNLHQPGIRRAIREKKTYKKMIVYKIKLNLKNKNLFKLAVDIKQYPN